MGATIHEDRFGVVSAVLSPAQVAANTTAEQTFTILGLKVGDITVVQKPTAQAGLGIAGSRVTAADTLGITFANPTAGNLTPTATQTYLIFWFRPETVATAVST